MKTEDEIVDQVLSILTKSVYTNGVGATIVNPEAEIDDINFALHVQQALIDVCGRGVNVVIHPGKGTLQIRVENGDVIREYYVDSFKDFDEHVRNIHQPLEQANPNSKNPHYLFGVAVEQALNRFYLKV